MSRIICYSKYKNRDVEVVWENIDNLGFTKNILSLKKQLKEMNIKVPDNFWSNCEEKVGNFVKLLT
jgi:hypothetical protein